MRRLTPLLALALLAGCETVRPCRENTLFVELTLSGRAQQASELAVTVVVDGDRRGPKTVAAGGTDGTLEVALSDYAPGKVVTVELVAQSGGVILARGSRTETLPEGCARLTLALGDAGGDGGADSPCAPTLTACPATTTCGVVDDGCGASVCPPCRLLQVSPALANAGDVLALDGVFDPSGAVVTFPGGAQVPATLAGSRHATVIVPAAAGMGPLTVTSNGSTTEGRFFWRAAFPLGLQPFLRTYAQTDVARQFPSLKEERFHFAGLTTDRHVYLIGGARSLMRNGTQDLDVATIHADGSLGDFARAAATLPAPSYSATALWTGPSVYLLGGGSDPAPATRNIARAGFAADGALESFTLLAEQLVTPRRGACGVVAGDHLYLIGGLDELNTTLSSIERAPIAPDGSLGAFAAVTSALVAPRDHHTCHVVGDNVLVVGGRARNAHDTVETAAVLGDGTLGPFALATNKLPQPRAGHGSVVVGGSLYVLGGGAVVQEQSNLVYTARVQGGMVGVFSTQAGATLRQGGYGGRRNGYVTVVGSNVYFIGGGLNELVGGDMLFGSDESFVDMATLNAGGGLGAFAQSMMSGRPQVPRDRAAVAAIGGGVYLVGGHDGTASLASVERAALTADGSLGPFADAAPVALATARHNPSLAVIGNSLYVVGGANDSGPLATIERALIRADGALEPFAPTPFSLPGGVERPSLAVIGDSKESLFGRADWLYAVYNSSVARAPISGGELSGNFSVVGPVLSELRNGPQVVLLDTRLYATYGFPMSNLAEVITVAIDGSLSGSWAAHPFGPNAVVGGLFPLVVGDWVHFAGGGSSFGLLTTVVRSRRNADDTLGVPANAGMLTAERSGAAGVVVGNRAYLIGGRSPTSGLLGPEAATLE